QSDSGAPRHGSSNTIPARAVHRMAQVLRVPQVSFLQPKRRQVLALSTDQSVQVRPRASKRRHPTRFQTILPELPLQNAKIRQPAMSSLYRVQYLGAQQVPEQWQLRLVLRQRALLRPAPAWRAAGRELSSTCLSPD